ncbi:hypothetical protein TNCV_4693001 [Trichonephila clavipes]|nr:hypothetical protein TNCV_4693001 [Trichonephila clavipes]
MSPSDFPHSQDQGTLKGHRFKDIETIKHNSTPAGSGHLKSLSSEMFRGLKHRWAKCVTANGAYFEGD